MKIGITLIVFGTVLVTISILAQQMGFGFGTLESRPGPLEVLLACWSGFLILGIGLVIGGIVRIIFKNRNTF